MSLLCSEVDLCAFAVFPHMSNQAIQAADLVVALCESSTKFAFIKFSFCVRISRCMYACLHVRIHVCMCVCMYVCMHATKEQNQQLEDVIASLQDASSDEATLELEFRRQHSELRSELTLQMEYLQRVNHSVNVTLLPCIPYSVSPDSLQSHIRVHACNCQHSQHIHVYYRSSAMVMESERVDSCSCLD